jgi:hypothetical protein
MDFMGAGIGLLVGAAQNYENSRAYIRQLEYETKDKIARMKASSDVFAADIDALSTTNFINNELANNAIVEAERAGGATVREAQVDIKVAEGKIQAKSEGITAGISKARELTTFYTQASKVVNQMQDKTTSQIVAIADNRDKATNATNAAAEKSYNQFLLSLAGVSSYSSIATPSSAGAVGNLIQGANTGQKLQTNIMDLTASNGQG